MPSAKRGWARGDASAVASWSAMLVDDAVAIDLFPLSTLCEIPMFFGVCCS
jgi:hypothetical protein